MSDVLPVSVNNMNDESLKAFVFTPNEYFKGVQREVVPSPFSDATKLRIEKLLEPQGLDAGDIAKRINIYAMVKVKNVDVID